MNPLYHIFTPQFEIAISVGYLVAFGLLIFREKL